VPLAAALYEERSSPLRIMSPRLAMVTGAAIVVVAFVVIASAYLQLARARTTIIPYKTTTTIVESWTYSYTRNPIYLGLAAIYIGIAIFFNSFWPFILLPLVMLVMQRGVIEREERYLEGKFGIDYVDYKSRVRRWL
jgi:protein-S-isoprenylcysteine O-methyltransferase Ste14